jgi:hypothetical protein
LFLLWLAPLFSVHADRAVTIQQPLNWTVLGYPLAAAGLISSEQTILKLMRWLFLAQI